MNPPDGESTHKNVRWVSNLLCSLRPGGTWVVPRSVSTVMVLSLDPRIVSAHCIFPDQKLLDALRDAGWIVQKRQTT